MFDISSLIKFDTNQIRRLEGSLTTYDSKKKNLNKEDDFGLKYLVDSPTLEPYERAIW